MFSKLLPFHISLWEILITQVLFFPNPQTAAIQSQERNLPRNIIHVMRAGGAALPVHRRHLPRGGAHPARAPPASPPPSSSLLFLLHITISHALFSHIDSDPDPGTPSQRLLLLFKAACLLLSILSTAAVVFSVASVYSAKHNALSFPRVLSVVPRVWRRLRLPLRLALLLLAADSGSGLAALTAFLVAIAYLAGLVYLSVVWLLASVVSVLEDYKGLDAMRKSKALIQGKLWTAAAIFFMLNLVFVVAEVAFRAWVVRGASHGVCAVVMLALVVQTVLYLVCKSYHHESNLSDRPPRGLPGRLRPAQVLKAIDVQMEQLHV